MMMNAYDEKYLEDAMDNLGEAFDYAKNSLKIETKTFFNLFIATNVASEFEKGNPKIIAGLSGTELVMEVLTKAGINYTFDKAQVSYTFNEEYWCGWVIAYYQWKSGISFREINDLVGIEEILKLYPTLHEVSEEKFVDVMNKIIKRKKTISKLQQRRNEAQLSQSELSKISKVNLRTLQQYEIGAKDINKASIKNVHALANALSCGVEDLIELNLN